MNQPLKDPPLLCQNQAIPTEAHFALDGALGELGRLAAETAGFCREHSLASVVEFDVNLVLEELFVNAVRHGGCEGIPDAVVIRLQLNDHGLRVEFSDRGRAFDPTAASAPSADIAAPLAARRPGGLGIHLVRQIMGDLEYHREGEWNRLIMRRPIRQGESKAETL